MDCHDKISAVILTLNEEVHIDRVIGSLPERVDEIIVMDSGSSDKTLEMAKTDPRVSVYVKKWKNYATQFNSAISYCKNSWVLRIDADEFIDEALRNAISTVDIGSQSSTAGYYFKRHLYFLGDEVKWGGVFPIKVIRLFKKEKGHIEDRWMDEHIVVAGEVLALNGRLIDDNLNSSEWWIDKHNKYASREAVDYLVKKYAPAMRSTKHSTASFDFKRQDSLKRLVKERFYYNLPASLRVLFYWLYRYYICMGFLDSRGGRFFHKLQGRWYRELVELRIKETEIIYLETGDLIKSIKEKLNIELE